MASLRDFSRASTRKTLHPPRALARWSSVVLALSALILGAAACTYDNGPVPSQNPTVTPCAVTCPPPVRQAQGGNEVSLKHFNLIYFDPWTPQSQDASSILLGAQTQFGTVSVYFASVSVAAGTTGAQLLQSTIRQDINVSQFSGLQDAGAINGAEIGYYAGEGESFTGYATQPNSPNVPVYINVMAATRGSAGIVFIAVSPLDPNSPDPSLTPAAEFDHLVNSVQWTS